MPTRGRATSLIHSAIMSALASSYKVVPTKPAQINHINRVAFISVICNLPLLQTQTFKVCKV